MSNRYLVAVVSVDNVDAFDRTVVVFEVMLEVDGRSNMEADGFLGPKPTAERSCHLVFVFRKMDLGQDNLASGEMTIDDEVAASEEVPFLSIASDIRPWCFFKSIRFLRAVVVALWTLTGSPSGAGFTVLWAETTST